MPKVTFDMEYEQVDAIVLQELKYCYEGLLQDYAKDVLVYDTKEEFEHTLASFERVIEYFMVHEEYEAYMDTFPLRTKK